MLKLKNIIKDYVSGDTKVRALKGIDVEFRDNEFVSILGPSGCGKTTLLNIIGGLDKYTSGDLIINGKSTKNFKDSDWDAYRNNVIGFVFQSYNLIPHQTVLSNVELAMTISGVSKAERRKMAIEALEKVGLGDQLNKKPNQMSGGQMQRVAIARAIVNKPDIILADEPTGALDSETSIQIMEILKEIAKEKLVIMVTHNPELAEKYSTRIVKFLDGKLIDDSDAYKSNEILNDDVKFKKTSMSFFTAIALSFNNLLTKKGRTFLTAFAGSIGIIGIALILALSSGVQNYITKTETEALANYPLQITKESSNFGEIFKAMSDTAKNRYNTKEEMGVVHSNNMMSKMISSMIEGTRTNNMKDFKAYLESDKCDIDKYTSDIQYMYSTQLNIYKDNTDDGIYKVNPSQVFNKLGMGAMTDMSAMSTMSATQYDVWSQLSDNEKYLDSKYEVLKGKFPEKYDEAVVIVDANGNISDYCLYALGIESMDSLAESVKAAMEKTAYEVEEVKPTQYTYDDLMNLKFRLLTNTDYFEKKEDGTWEDKSKDDMYVMSKLKDALEIKIVGVIKAKEEGNNVVDGGGVGYRSDLMQYLVNKVNESEIAKQQVTDKETDVFTGITFESVKKDEDTKTMSTEEFQEYVATLPADEQSQIQAYMAQLKQSGMSDEEAMAKMMEYMGQNSTEATYDGNLAILGISNLDEPSSINIYPKDFEAKDNVTDIIDKYNSTKDKEEDEISYTDYIGLMLSSVTTIINAITYVLVGFVSISLVVSSIMIGIITYISVLERTKEIGILRAIGASKRDISRVFNAETFIIGLVSGILGIGVTVLLCIPANMIIKNLTDISGLAALPWYDGVILVCISMFLTVVAGLVPAKMAAKKDPVVALRSE